MFKTDKISELAFADVINKYKDRSDVYIKMRVETDVDDYLGELKGYELLKNSGVIPKLYEHKLQFYDGLYSFYFVLEHCGTSIRDLYPLSIIDKNGILTLWPIDLSVNDEYMLDQIKFQCLLDQISRKLEGYGVKQRDHATDNYCYDFVSNQLKVIDLEWIR